ncbi:U32 family peptidase [Candidatus Chloroploca sp. M-50]|uniref:U32 family peptidase n=1 Tax=Candidatus Chloroploca mongolica TaxID=2528176 RepID=A0ABS4DEE8_9CHLR|nr:U32 family peptidase [Candidatus Chloroploca mongolica]MBP1467824.1 U32 family peptidase [Candidatus Chloroploca mongolica]
MMKPEVMSPAGYWPQLHAAIEAGADAVYFGLKHFSARAKVGFTLEELPEVMRTLHQRRVKGYVTFNTLMFDHELLQAARVALAIAEAGADAFIVQDVGIARLLQQLVPEIEVHGSTQMSITSAEGVELARQFGVSRVVLARELSLKEIAAIRAATTLELEMFVHGALCVSYSGQCFSSEAWGGRSANRGQCAQACRLPYDLLVDGAPRPLGEARYLLSPGDLYALHEMPAIVQLGVSALKIEGRYKDAAYVALTTAAYRKAVDEAWAGLPLSITPYEDLQLTQVYSRGMGPYFLTGTDHQAVVRGRAPRHRGVLVARVAKVLTESILAELDPAAAASPLKPGDGIVFDAAAWRSPEEPEEGGRVYHVYPALHGLVELEFGYDAVDLHRIRPGDLIWRTLDPDLERAVRPLTQPASPVRRQPVVVHAVAQVGEPLVLTWQHGELPALRVTVRSPEPLAAAERRGLTEALLHEQLGRLGTTPYYLAALNYVAEGNPFVANSLLNQLRREATDLLAELQGQPAPIRGGDPAAVLAQMTPSRPVSEAEVAPPTLHLLVRTPEQLEAALAARPASITLDYLDLYGLRPAVEQVQAAGIEARVASPRVLKPDEQRIVHFLRKLDCTILVRSTGLLHALREAAIPRLVGDFSLNAANMLTAQTMLELGLARLTPTYDLNADQIAKLAAELDPDLLEIVAYQHLPIFHTEHCVFCRFLSNGTSYKDCGHPCEKHRIALRDQQGRAHPVMADVGCRNTVFNAEAQEASRHLAAWRTAGLRHFRLEFVHERGEEVARVTDAFQATLAGTMTPAELGRHLQQITPQGTTEGSLFVPDGYATIPLM